MFGGAGGDDLFSVFESSSPSTTPNKNKRKESGDNEQTAPKPTEYGANSNRDLNIAGKRARQGEWTTVVPSSETSSSSTITDNNTTTTTNSPEKNEETQKDPGGKSTEDSTSVCLHEICIPPDIDVPLEERDPPFPMNPARTWKFTLDPFQRKSVACIEQGHSVLVSAHTSAGKTVIAEYAIAKSLKCNQRVIYTSPIKALSNQKYRELYENFQDVGLMTGDTTLNPTASCIVMTTEILRSMLYRGSQMMREVAWVIFDEIHYMRDKERGVVWEETIILLPDKVRYVFLSATIPNAKEFASWIAKIKKQPCHVVYTDVRPTPLQHYIFPHGGDGLHLVVDEKGNFREDNFQAAVSKLGEGPLGMDRGKTKKQQDSDIYKIVKMIMERNYQPVIVFSFSKRECEVLALQMSKMEFTDEDEKKLIEKVFSNAIDSLSDDDRKLPQIHHILPLLRRGIGIHHSGLLPVIKEVIEILFQEGLIKALFATETFSMGLNMPAKTVVFTSVRKFDGAGFRWVTSGEYIQMSGRAGRRGLDERGIVILMLDLRMEPQVAKNMLKGAADPLNSSFHIGYNSLLNLLRVEGIDPEHMLQSSFHQFQNDRSLPGIQQKINALTEDRNAIVIPNEASVSEYYSLREQLELLNSQMISTINMPIHSLPYMQPGRLVRVRNGDVEWGWGVVINFQKKADSKDNSQSVVTDTPASQFIVDVLLNCDESSPPTAPQPHPSVSAKSFTIGSIQVVPVVLTTIAAISSVRVYIPKDLRTHENRHSVGKSLKEVTQRFPDGIPLLDPVEDMNINDPSFLKLIRKTETLEDRITQWEADFKKKNPKANLSELLEVYKDKKGLDNEIKALSKMVKQGQSIVLKYQLKCMKRVLRRLGYTNQDDIVETKGRVACEINAADELVLTELIFSGVFGNLEVEQCCALLSCFIFDEQTKAKQVLKEELAGPFRTLQDTARRVATVVLECKLEIDVDEYVEKFTPAMMEVVYEWSKGAKFSEVCKLTEVFEGSIIRAMRRLDELLRQLCAAAKSIGNSALENKFSTASNKIKRDIVFASSLYL